MQEEVTYRWRIQWCGKWTTTGHHCTEEAIRKDHPEAIRLDDTKRVQLVPSTSEDMQEAMYGNTTGAFLEGPKD